MILKKVILGYSGFKVIDVEAIRKNKIYVIHNWGLGGSRYLKFAEVEEVQDLSQVSTYLPCVRCCLPEDVEKAKTLMAQQVIARTSRVIQEAEAARAVAEAAQ